MGITGPRNFYDRGPIQVGEYYDSGSVAAHSWTARISYTVPTNKKAYMCLAFISLYVAIATAGKSQAVRYDVTPSGGSAGRIIYLVKYDTTQLDLYETYTTNLYLFSGDQLEALTYHSDTVNHNFKTGCAIVEYDG